MHGGAIDAKEDTICNRSPRRILRVAIEARLVFGFGFELSEKGVLVRRDFRSHGLREREGEWCPERMRGGELCAGKALVLWGRRKLTTMRFKGFQMRSLSLSLSLSLFFALVLLWLFR
eukprot:TRINITY_DN92_c0_g1_i1.p3 TRINITY_DN92_c0_g1~~TRINITY_DN92_c0_g1_i1.p3  ORF type:complete len:118 (-),score=17.78 TRINITY_DN92_c0_g1_i1:2-355(-)